MPEVAVHKATPSEYNHYITAPNIAQAIRESNAGITPEYEEESYVSSFGKYSLLFTLAKAGKGLYETHIACPTDSIRASRLLVLGGMQWLASIHDTDTRGIFTTCPEGKIANFVRRLRFEQTGKVGDMLFFAYVFK